MRKIRVALLLLVAAAGPLAAQVLPPAEIAEPGPQQLQDKYYDQLKQVAADIRAHSFPYPFY